jgi:hypothetical protein
MALKPEFSEDAWAGFAGMFAATHRIVSKADDAVELEETEVIFSIVEGEFDVPVEVHEAFDADPELAREVLADTGAIVQAMAPSRTGERALRTRDHLGEWIEAAATPEERDQRTRLTRGLFVAVMYLGLTTAHADGSLDETELESWRQVGHAFGLSDELLVRLRELAAE